MHFDSSNAKCVFYFYRCQCQSFCFVLVIHIDIMKAVAPNVLAGSVRGSNAGSVGGSNAGSEAPVAM